MLNIGMLNCKYHPTYGTMNNYTLKIAMKFGAKTFQMDKVTYQHCLS